MVTTPDLPLNLKAVSVIELPRPDPKDPRWDNDANNIVNALVTQFDQQEQEGLVPLTMSRPMPCT